MCSTANQVSLSFTTSQSSLKLMSIKSVTPSNRLILFFPLFLLPSIFSNIKVFSNKWPLDQVANVLEFQHQSFQRIFRVDFLKDDCFDLLAVQEILKRVLYHHSSKSINSLVLSFLYGPTLISVHDYWKNHSVDYTDFASKVMSLLFNMLSRFVIAFLPKSKCLLISWLQSPSAVILEPKKIKSVTVSIFYPSICHEVMEPDSMILVF